MSKKPNFVNKETKQKKYKQLKRYVEGNFGTEPRRHKISEDFFPKAVISEDLKDEFINDPD